MDSIGNAVCQTCGQELPLTIEAAIEAVMRKEWQRLVKGDVFCCADCLQALEEEPWSLIEIQYDEGNPDT